MDNHHYQRYSFTIYYFSVISPYKEMFDVARWQRLIEQFRQENYKLYQLSTQSVFTVALQAGLSALKTPYPFETFNLNNLI